MGGGRSRRRGPQQGDDLRYDLTIDFEQAVFGQEQEIKIPHLETCDTCGGSGAKPGSSPTTCGTCGGAGQVRRTPFVKHLTCLSFPSWEAVLGGWGGRRQG